MYEHTIRNNQYSDICFLNELMYLSHYGALVKFFIFSYLLLSVQSSLLKKDFSDARDLTIKNSQYYDFTDSLIAYLPFYGNAKDEGPGALGTTVYQATLTTDRFNHPNSAYHFSSDSYVLIANNNLLDMQTNSYTIAAWIYLDRNNNNMRIFSHGSFGCTPGYMFRTNGKGLHQEFSCSSGGCSLAAGTTRLTLNTGVWYSVINTVERDGKGSIYVNGDLAFEVPGTVSKCSISSGVNGYIGYAPEGEQFYGKIDDVIIYKRALTSLEVKEIYKNQPPVLENNQFKIDLDAPTTITSAMLSATDSEDQKDGLIFTVSDVKNGYFHLITAPAGASITSFTQQQIQAESIIFIPDGSKKSPAFQVKVSDGLLRTSPTAAFVEDMPSSPSLLPTAAPSAAFFKQPNNDSSHSNKKNPVLFYFLLIGLPTLIAIASTLIARWIWFNFCEKPQQQNSYSGVGFVA